MNIGMEMEQLPQELYLIVLEYSPSLSEKQILEKPQPTNLNGRCLHEVVGSPVGRAAPLSVGVGFSLHPSPSRLTLRSLLTLLFFLQIPGYLQGLVWFPWGCRELLYEQAMGRKRAFLRPPEAGPLSQVA